MHQGQEWLRVGSGVATVGITDSVPSDVLEHRVDVNRLHTIVLC